jgi:hypothetical protein
MARSPGDAGCGSSWHDERERLSDPAPTRQLSLPQNLWHVPWTILNRSESKMAGWQRILPADVRVGSVSSSSFGRWPGHTQIAASSDPALTARCRVNKGKPYLLRAIGREARISRRPQRSALKPERSARRGSASLLSVISQRANTNPRWRCRLFSLCGKRPHHGRAAQRLDELAPSHSITSSARASSVSGTVRPSAWRSSGR